MKRPRILVVEDVDVQREAIAEYLARNGFDVTQAPDGNTFRSLAVQVAFDLAIIDLHLPDEDGLNIVRDLRARDRCGIIVLTANDDQTDKIVGLELGADDFLTKPVPLRELLARIRTILRRVSTSQLDAVPPAIPVALQFGNWILDDQQRALRNDTGDRLPLTAAEYILLRELMQKAGVVLDREHLMKAVFHRSWQYEDRSLDVLVTRLRRKLEPTGENERIKAVRGVGYILN
ncbi:transcriptional regulatory protein AruR [Aureimonas endophytica]|uniref:Transcriptional regulatory protein AruR n=1 Tax=Aureimonas endophytica TaxID=2027858 RepID=A0A917E1S4_9HYPH|nr:response regulator transcription factor [Aureimonas endophytica]GGD93671.1 transcriptional regulatory protein AruR [Aureimonas endophytica]